MACAQPGALSIPAPGQIADPAVEASPQPQEKSPMNDSLAVVEAWMAERHGGRARASAFGDHTGYPAFVVTIGDPGERPEKEVPVIVAEGEVLVGASGWIRYLSIAGREDATRVASAWLLLAQGQR
jgi:hypothetical protein